jgi:SanA protein
MTEEAPSKKKRIFKRVRNGVGIVLLLGIVFVVWANVVPGLVSHGLHHQDAGAMPHHEVGLIFGCDERIGGRDNLYFSYRIDAAVELWNAGKVGCFIVSGDNRVKNYNEPEAMRAALVARGVPTERIVSDFAGLRTLDSVVRAKEIFGVDDVVFISQRFQNERAIYLAKAHGMTARGFDAIDPSSSLLNKTRTREIGARVKMWLDVNVLGTRPKHLGKRVVMPEILGKRD